MGRREALLALVDELAIAAAVVIAAAFAAKELGAISTKAAAVISIAAVAGLSLVGYLAAKAQLKKPEAGPEALVGKKGRAVEDLQPEGVVLVNGEYWRACSSSGERIPAGATVVVKKVEGLKLYVEKEA